MKIQCLEISGFVPTQGWPEHAGDAVSEALGFVTRAILQVAPWAAAAVCSSGPGRCASGRP